MTLCDNLRVNIKIEVYAKKSAKSSFKQACWVMNQIHKSCFGRDVIQHLVSDNTTQPAPKTQLAHGFTRGFDLILHPKNVYITIKQYLYNYIPVDLS